MDAVLLRKIQRAAARKSRVISLDEPVTAPKPVMVIEEPVAPLLTVDEDKPDRSRSRDRAKKKRRRQRSSSSSAASKEDREAHQTMLQAAAASRPALRYGGLGAGMLDVISGGLGGTPVSLGADGLNRKVCVKFLQGECPSGRSCLESHPTNPADRAQWISYFNRQPCKYGDQCVSLKCLYEHPHRAGYSGGPLTLGGVSL